MDSNKTPEVYTAINAVMHDLGKVGIEKAGYNESQRFKFRGIDQMYEAISPLLSKHGLVILPRVISRIITEHPSKSGGVNFRVSLEVEYDFVSMSDGSKHTVKMFGEAMDSGDKATNKAVSAALKYVYLQVFCIPLKGETDADAQTPEESVDVNKTIDREQGEEINALLETSGADESAFFEYYGVKRLRDIRASQYSDVCARLRKKVADKKPEETAPATATQPVSGKPAAVAKDAPAPASEAQAPAERQKFRGVRWK